MCNECDKHGQYFAWLEAARDECERQFQAKVEEVIREMCRAEAAEARCAAPQPQEPTEFARALAEHDAKLYGTGFLVDGGYVAPGRVQMVVTHHAEARCAELEKEVQFLRSHRPIARELQAANARAREAEGLLRHWQAWICGPSELHKATAAFLAASGETK